MGKIRRKFSLEFKQQVVAEVSGGLKSLSEAAREYQISPSVINRWRAQAGTFRLAATPSARERALESENQRLKAKIGDLVMQVELLKKYHASIQRRRSVDTSVITGKNWEQFRRGAK